MMNAEGRRARAFRDTHFANSHGLDEKGHHSSASDLGVLARYAMRNQRFRAIVEEEFGSHPARERLPEDREHQPHAAATTKAPMGSRRAGPTMRATQSWLLLAEAIRSSTPSFSALRANASASQRRRELLDWGFAHYREQKLASAGTVVGEAPVTDYLDTTVPGAFSKDDDARGVRPLGPDRSHRDDGCGARARAERRQSGRRHVHPARPGGRHRSARRHPLRGETEPVRTIRHWSRARYGGASPAQPRRPRYQVLRRDSSWPALRYGTSVRR